MIGQDINELKKALINVIAQERLSGTFNAGSDQYIATAFEIIKGASNTDEILNCLKGLLGTLQAMGQGYQIGLYNADNQSMMQHYAETFSDIALSEELKNHAALEAFLSERKIFSAVEKSTRQNTMAFMYQKNLSATEQQDLRSIEFRVVQSESNPTVTAQLAGYSARASDVSKLDLKKGKTLRIPSERLQPTNAPRFGGMYSYGPQVKESHKGNEPQVYYIGPHKVEEYFATEMLNFVGVQVPKFRIADSDFQKSASKQLKGYIPMATFFSKNENLLGTELGSIAARYELDLPNQLVRNKETGENHRLGGNFFAADIGAELIQDTDFQPHDFNYGVVFEGNKFRAVAIDKDQWTPFLARSSYDEIKKNTDYRLLDSPIFANRTDEQILSMVSGLNRLISPIHGDIAPIHYIFFNSRVQHEIEKGTFSREYLYVCMKNMIDNVKLIVEHYEDKLGRNAINDFEKREILREQIVNKVITGLDQSLSEETVSTLKEDLMEDLKAVYYESHFSNQTSKKISTEDLTNVALLNELQKDAKIYLKNRDVMELSPVRPTRSS